MGSRKEWGQALTMDFGAEGAPRLGEQSPRRLAPHRPDPLIARQAGVQLTIGRPKVQGEDLTPGHPSLGSTEASDGRLARFGLISPTHPTA
jgi:hypothetical protein